MDVKAINGSKVEAEVAGSLRIRNGSLRRNRLHNPAGEVINAALPPIPSVKEHFRALPYDDVAEALKVVDASRASIAARACLKFLVLTAVRSGEARSATWDEINIEAATWTIPGERMKAGR